MATCNPCYDQHDKIARSREKAHQICGVVSQLNLTCMQKLNAAQRERFNSRQASLRESLTRICYKYLSALAEKHGLVWSQPVTEIVDMIMENPAKAKEAFDLANNYIKRMAAAT